MAIIKQDYGEIGGSGAKALFVPITYAEQSSGTTIYGDFSWVNRVATRGYYHKEFPSYKGTDYRVVTLGTTYSMFCGTYGSTSPDATRNTSSSCHRPITIYEDRIVIGQGTKGDGSTGYAYFDEILVARCEE